MLAHLVSLSHPHPCRPIQIRELLLLRCLASVARRFNCSMILSGDTLESTATAALCHVAAGRFHFAREGREMKLCRDARCRGSALLSRVAVDTFDSSARMRIVRPLRNIMRIECEAALAELCPTLPLPQGYIGAECDPAATPPAAVGGPASCIGDLMKGFVTLLQVGPQCCKRSRHLVTQLAG